MPLDLAQPVGDQAAKDEREIGRDGSAVHLHEIEPNNEYDGDIAKTHVTVPEASFVEQKIQYEREAEKTDAMIANSKAPVCRPRFTPPDSKALSVGLFVILHPVYDVPLCMYRQRFVLPMNWDFAETNPLSDTTGNFRGGIEWVTRVIDHMLAAFGKSGNASVVLGSALTPTLFQRKLVRVFTS
jgi:hypothetical protein